MRVTIRDVAREANVSIATVSRVLNQSGPVRAATRERVEAVAARLRYAPSSAARSLITRKTKTLGVLLKLVSHGEYLYYHSIAVAIFSRSWGATNSSTPLPRIPAAYLVP